MSQVGYSTPAPEGLLEQRIEEVQEYWHDVTLHDVTRSMPTLQRIPLRDGRSVAAAIVRPELTEYDYDNALALNLAYVSGWSPHHFILAKVMQQIVAPEKQVVVLPNNSFRESAYELDDSQRKRLASGDITPIAEMQMEALENLDIGNIALTGYSQGGLNALAIGAVGSNKLRISGINADEAPSKQGRHRGELMVDFLRSGGSVLKAVKESGLTASSQAMSPINFYQDLVKFGLKAMSKEGRLVAEAMTGSADYLVDRAAKQVWPGSVKLGYVEGSRLFDPTSLSPNTRRQTLLLNYSDEHGASNKHASAENVIVHARMVADGLLQD